MRIFGEEFERRAEVYRLYGYSAHADPKPAQNLAEGLQKMGYGKVIVPQRGEKHAL